MKRDLHDIAIRLDRSAGQPLAEQISASIADAIRSGRLAPGARLPSWHDLAAQLGVARGTVRIAYDNLRDLQLVYTAGAAGTRVAQHSPAPPARPAPSSPPPAATRAAGRPAPFQVGVPAHDVFPFKTWSRIMARAARAAAALPLGYPDPFGEQALRSQIAAYLGLARGIACDPAQVFITQGYAGALNMALRATGREGSQAWIEDPGYASSREILRLAGVDMVAVPVDEEGLDVEGAKSMAPHAALAIVTPGQQAPLGATMSLRRRHALLEWAAATSAWIVEDDYLGELQLQGRATPALAARDQAGRVIHIGTFSKTIHPALRVAFMVAPPGLVDRVAAVAEASGGAPPPAIQLAVAEFLREGHHLRHLRRMKRLYLERRQRLAACLRELGLPHAEAGLAVLLHLPQEVDDAQLAKAARAQGFAPSALSWWRAGADTGQRGLLLGVTNLPTDQAMPACRRLALICAPSRVPPTAAAR